MLYLHVIEAVREDVYRRPLVGGWSAAEARLRSEFGAGTPGLDDVLIQMRSSRINLAELRGALNAAAERRAQHDRVRAGTDGVTERRRKGEAAPERGRMSQAAREGQTIVHRLRWFCFDLAVRALHD